MTWYRSLYWRIALGVVGFLAAMLIVQAVLFVWAVSQSGRSLPGQSPARLGMTVALDLSSVLERDPQSDLARYVHDQYAQYPHPFFVMLVDGTLITSGSSTVADPLLAMARAAIQRWTERPPGRRGERTDGPRFERPMFSGPDGFEGAGRGGPPPGIPFGGGERVGPRREVAGHRVEGAGDSGDLVAAAIGCARGQVAGSELARRRLQRAQPPPRGAEDHRRREDRADDQHAGGDQREHRREAAEQESERRLRRHNDDAG